MESSVETDDLLNGFAWEQIIPGCFLALQGQSNQVACEDVENSIILEDYLKYRMWIGRVLKYNRKN